METNSKAFINYGAMTHYDDKIKEYIRNNTPTLSSLGVHASPTELNYTRGVTSSIQDQLNAKALKSHSHDDTYYTESEIDAMFESAAPNKHNHTVSEITDFPESMPANGGNSDTVNNHTVKTDVPENAVFTDTKYTHPTTAGNKHIPAGGSAGQILRWSANGTAVWGNDNNTTYTDFTGATTSAAGSTGLVPAPALGAANRYLRSDGTWQVPPDTNTIYTHPKSGVTAGTYKSVTVDANGHVTAGSNPTTLSGYGITDAAAKSHTHNSADINSLDASKITSGTIDIARLPAGALERCVVVEDDTARFALTTSNAQLGDTVKVRSTGLMYLIVDASKLSSEAGYEVYTAGAASSVPWSGITGKPSTFTPSSHTHDDRYYTESEMNTLLNGKAATSHTHTKSQITDFPTKLSQFTNDKGYVTTDTNTTYSFAVAAKSAANGAAKLRLTGSDSTNKDILVTGSGATTVTTDANGNLVISSTDTDTKYTHPSATAYSSGLYKVTVDNKGHVTAATEVTKADITNLGIPSVNTTYGVMTGASSSAAGGVGLVPAPAAGASNRYLRSDGTWQVPPDTNTHYTSKNVVGSSTTAVANTTVALANGKVYLNSVENNAVTSSHNIKGGGATTVTTDASGNIIVTSTNTTYSNFVKSGSGAKAGLVPAPSTTAGTTKYLREDGTWQVPPNTTYAVATQSANGLMSAADKKILDESPRNVYATCTTAAAEQVKVITLDNPNLALKDGDLLHIRFSYNNTFNATADKPVTFTIGSDTYQPYQRVDLADSGTKPTGTNLWIHGQANVPSIYKVSVTNKSLTFVNRYWDDNTYYSNASLGQGFGTCTTAEATAAKVVSLGSYGLSVGGVVAVKFTYAVPASATLNINNRGAKKIQYRGGDITAGVIRAGDIATFIYTGSVYVLLTRNYATSSSCITGGDYNNCIDEGHYELLGNSSSATKNAPDGNNSDNNFYVFVQKRGSTYLVQTATSVRDPLIRYTRALLNGTWSAWTRLKFTDTTYSAATSSTLGLVKIGSNITNSSGTISLTKDNVTAALGYTPPTTNTTYSNFVKSGTGAAAGLVPAPSTTAGTTKYLREDGTWQVPPNTTYSNFVKSGSGAKAGLVPAPSTTAGTTKYLREDGTWQVPPNTTYSDATTSAHGLLSVADKKSLDILKSPLATCATERATAAKVATLANFALAIGVTIAVKFTATDTNNPASGNLTLNVNGTGAKNIGFCRNGSKAAFTYSSAGYFCNNAIRIFTYDGAYWLCMDWNPDNNTTYSNMTAATASAAGKAGLVPAPAAGKQTSFLRGDGTWVVPTNTDTKNTSGSTNTSSKIFLVGATSQAANPVTYSHDTAYVGTDGCVYSNSQKTITEDVLNDMLTQINNTLASLGN